MPSHPITKYILPLWPAVLVGLSLAGAQAEERPWLGICVTGTSTQTVSVTDRPSAVSRVLSVRGPAASAGILVGDFVIALDGRPIVDAQDLMCRLAGKQPGEVARLIVLRDRQTLAFAAALAQWPDDQCAPMLICENTATEGADVNAPPATNSASRRNFPAACGLNRVLTRPGPVPDMAAAEE
jgi:predicted metalloprotease with PDZ domain